MERGQPTVLITVSKDIIRRNILDTDFWPAFRKANPETRLVLVVETGKGAYYRERFGEENVVIEEYAKEPHSGFTGPLFWLIRCGIRSKSTTFYRWRAYKRGHAGLLPTLAKSAVSSLFSRFAWYKRLLRRLVLRTRPPAGVEALFHKHGPDLVIALSLIDNEFDALFALAAKRRGVRVIGMVRSWDNLNHHGLMAVAPDRFLFQNQWLTEAARRYQALDLSSLPHEIIGLPHYDAYKHPGPLLEPREKFLPSLGLDPKKKLIFHGGSDLYLSEDLLPRTLELLIEKEKIHGSVQVLFSPHPSSAFKKEDYQLSGLKHVVFDGAFQDKSKPSFDSTARFVNILHHADVVISMGSTLSIDAAAFDTPSLNVGFEDSSRKVSYWESAERFHDSFDHEARLVATGGTRVARSLAEYIEDINTYLADPSVDSQGRARIIEEFASPFDGHSGERLGRIISEEVQTSTGPA